MKFLFQGLKITICLVFVLLISRAYPQNIKNQTEKTLTQNSTSKSQLPEGKNWKLVWCDEFDDTTLDTSKWGFRLHIMQTRHETWTDDAYEFDGQGNLLLKAYEKDGEFHTSQLQTGRNFMDRPGNQYGGSKLTWPISTLETPRFVHKYGYYEIRCKLPTQEGWWVAFWLQSPTIGATLDPLDSGVEIDIMENFKRENIISHNIHWDGYGTNHKSAGSGPVQVKPTDDQFHTYGVDWSPTGYVFYMDGVETWRVSGPVSHREQFILVSAECEGYRAGKASARIKQAILPDYFVVDYVRVYDEINSDR